MPAEAGSGHWREWHRGHGCSLDPEVPEVPCALCKRILAYGKAQRLAALEGLLDETLEYQKACGNTVMYGGDALSILRNHIRALRPPEQFPEQPESGGDGG